MNCFADVTVALAAPICSESAPRVSPTGMSAALKLSSTVFGRWIVHTLSWESTERPMVEPVTQWFGSGLGQKASTSNMGTFFAPFCAWTVRRYAPRHESTTSNATIVPVDIACLKVIVFHPYLLLPVELNV